MKKKANDVNRQVMNYGFKDAIELVSNSNLPATIFVMAQNNVVDMLSMVMWKVFSEIIVNKKLSSHDIALQFAKPILSCLTVLRTPPRLPQHRSVPQ